MASFTDFWGHRQWLFTSKVMWHFYSVMDIAFGDTSRGLPGILFLMYQAYIHILCIPVINPIRNLLRAFCSTVSKYMLMFWWFNFYGGAGKSSKSSCMCRFLHLAILKIWSTLLSLIPGVEQWPHFGHYGLWHIFLHWKNSEPYLWAQL